MRQHNAARVAVAALLCTWGALAQFRRPDVSKCSTLPASTLCSGRNAQVDADLTNAQLANQCNATVLRVPGIPMPIARYHLPVPDPRGAAIEWQYACAVKASMFITAIPPGAGFTGLKSAEVQCHSGGEWFGLGKFNFPYRPYPCQNGCSDWSTVTHKLKPCVATRWRFARMVPYEQVASISRRKGVDAYNLRLVVTPAKLVPFAGIKHRTVRTPTPVPLGVAQRHVKLHDHDAISAHSLGACSAAFSGKRGSVVHVPNGLSYPHDFTIQGSFKLTDPFWSGTAVFFAQGDGQGMYANTLVRVGLHTVRKKDPVKMTYTHRTEVFFHLLGDRGHSNRTYISGDATKILGEAGHQGSWYAFAAVRKEGYAALYLNGQVLASKRDTSGSLSAIDGLDLGIGAVLKPDGPKWFYRGLLFDIQVLATHGEQDPKLLARWPLAQCPAAALSSFDRNGLGAPINKVVDSSSLHNHGGHVPRAAGKTGVRWAKSQPELALSESMVASIGAGPNDGASNTGVADVNAINAHGSGGDNAVGHGSSNGTAASGLLTCIDHAWSPAARPNFYCGGGDPTSRKPRCGNTIQKKANSFVLNEEGKAFIDITFGCVGTSSQLTMDVHPFQNSPKSFTISCAYEGRWRELGTAHPRSYLDAKATTSWEWKTETINFKPCSAKRWRIGAIVPSGEMLGYVSVFNVQMLWRVTAAPTPSPTRACACGHFNAITADSPKRGSCLSCPEGTYRPPGDPLDSRCRRCAHGKFAAKKGSCGCSPCPDHFLELMKERAAGNGGPSTQGSALTAASKAALKYCAKCPPGRFEPELGTLMSAAAKVKGGAEHAAALAQIALSAKQEKSHDGQQTRCACCDQGRFADGYGLGSCSVCPAGQYSGMCSPSCAPCPHGKWTAKRSGMNRCIGREEKTYSAAEMAWTDRWESPDKFDKTMHALITHATRSPTPAPTPAPCGAGMAWSPLFVKRQDPNDPAKETLAKIAKCIACPRGQFQGKDAAWAGVGQRTMCNVCPVGKYQPDTGAAACRACPAGKTTPTFMERFKARCTLRACKPGQFLKRVLQQEFCYFCPAGKFKQGNNRVPECTACPSGKYNAHLARGSCIACQAGRYTEIESSQKCKQCPAGKVTAAHGVGCVKSGSPRARPTKTPTPTPTPHAIPTPVPKSHDDSKSRNVGDSGAEFCTCQPGDDKAASAVRCVQRSPRGAGRRLGRMSHLPDVESSAAVAPDANILVVEHLPLHQRLVAWRRRRLFDLADKLIAYGGEAVPMRHVCRMVTGECHCCECSAQQGGASEEAEAWMNAFHRLHSHPHV